MEISKSNIWNLEIPMWHVEPFRECPESCQQRKTDEPTINKQINRQCVHSGHQTRDAISYKQIKTNQQNMTKRMDLRRNGIPSLTISPSSPQERNWQRVQDSNAHLISGYHQRTFHTLIGWPLYVPIEWAIHAPLYDIIKAITCNGKEGRRRQSGQMSTAIARKTITVTARRLRMSTRGNLRPRAVAQSVLNVRRTASLKAQPRHSRSRREFRSGRLLVPSLGRNFVSP